MKRVITDAFFDGFGPGALFVRPSRPGTPTAVFASEGDSYHGCDERQTMIVGDIVEEIVENRAIPSRYSKLKLSKLESRTLELIVQHGWILPVAAELSETPAAVAQRLLRLYRRLLPLASRLRTASQDVAHRVTSA